MSAGLLQQLGGAGVAVATGGKKVETQQLAMTYGAATDTAECFHLVENTKLKQIELA
jgi:hypothetical protein